MKEGNLISGCLSVNSHARCHTHQNEKTEGPQSCYSKQSARKSIGLRPHISGRWGWKVTNEIGNGIWRTSIIPIQRRGEIKSKLLATVKSSPSASLPISILASARIHISAKEAVSQKSISPRFSLTVLLSSSTLFFFPSKKTKKKIPRKPALLLRFPAFIYFAHPYIFLFGPPPPPPYCWLSLFRYIAAVFLRRSYYMRERENPFWRRVFSLSLYDWPINPENRCSYFTKKLYTRHLYTKAEGNGQRIRLKLRATKMGKRWPLLSASGFLPPVYLYIYIHAV